MNTCSSQLPYRQSIDDARITKEIARVGIWKFVLARADEIAILRTVLGSCVGLIGHREWVGFMTHIHYPETAVDLLGQLQDSIQAEVSRALKIQDFHLTISGGNSIFPGLWHPGRGNIAQVLWALERKPDAQVHVCGTGDNTIELSLETGAIISR